MMIRLLGPLDLGDGTSVRGARERRLLGLLALEAPATVTATTAADWVIGPDAPSRAGLHVATSRLRRQLRDNGADASIERLAGGLRLVADRRTIDAAAFVDLADAATQLPDGSPARADALSVALDLWRGDILTSEDVPHHPVATSLTERRLALTEELFATEIDLGLGADRLGELLARCRATPQRERLWCLAMTALYREGRQVEALALFQEARTLLVDGFGLEPGPDLVALEQQILRGDPALARPDRSTADAATAVPTTPAGNVAADQPPLYGRQDDLAGLAELTSRHRLVTVVGAGGVGKTRLAVSCAAMTATSTEGGAWLVDLARLNTGALIPTAIVETLGLRPEGRKSALDTACQHLASQRCLLVLDNCEHVIDGAATVVASLLAAAPGISVIATSREPLHVETERVMPLSPLAVADGAGPAVELFLDRAERAGAPLPRDDETVQAAAAICRRLDGLPLAIELAAARTRSMSLAEIAERLDRRFQLLTGGARGAAARQRTLEATVAWSYDMLEPDVRDLFARLAVFAGGFELAAAVAVGGRSEFETLDAIDQLVDRSLLDVDQRSDATRYSMLETIRQYGRERLVEHRSADDARNRHLEWLAAFVADTSRQLQDAHHDAMARTDAELGNIRVGLDWACHDPALTETGLSIATGLGRYWYLRGITAEGAQWIERLRAAGPPLPAAVNARTLCDLGFFLLQAGEPHAGLLPLDESLALARQTGDPALLTRTLHYLARTAFGIRDPAEVLAMLDEGRRIAFELGDELHIYLNSVVRVNWYVTYSDDEEATLEVGRWLVDRYVDDPSPHVSTHAHEVAAWLDISRRLIEPARTHLSAAFDNYRELRNPGCTCHALEALAWWLAAGGETQAARDVLASVLDIRERSHYARPAFESVAFNAVTALLGEDSPGEHAARPFDDLTSGIDHALGVLASPSPR